TGTRTEKMRVLVIGAGVRGLAVANGLIRHGHQVQVFEHAEQLRTGGAGLTIWSNGTRALRELGVDIEPLGRVLTSLRAMTETGRFLWEADLAAVTAELGSPTVQIPRERLIAALADRKSVVSGKHTAHMSIRNYIQKKNTLYIKQP